MPLIVAWRSVRDADDVAALLTFRLTRATARPRPGVTPDLIAGRFPVARDPLPKDAARALPERRALIETQVQGVRRRTRGVERPSTTATTSPARNTGPSNLDGVTLA
jgi:hypothetical protein